MPIFDKQVRAIEEFNRNPGVLLVQLSKQFEAEILDYITDNQLFEGLDSEGKDLTPPYTAFTISVKLSKGQVVDRVTLRDEGDFYADMEIDFRRDEFVILNSNNKLRRLENKYGNKILGLSGEGLEELTILVKPELINHLREKLTER